MISAMDNGIVHLVSTRAVHEVLEHLLALLQSKSITVFAVVDHSGEAAKVGLEMRDTKLVLFGNPKAGTQVMLASPDSALDLPLKILIAEDPDGHTRVSYNSVAYLQRRFDLAPDVASNLSAIEVLAAAIAK